MSRPEQSPRQDQLSSSHLDRLVGELVEVINGGKRSAQSRFVRSHVSERGMKETPPDRYLSVLEKVHSQTESVEVVDFQNVGNTMEARLTSRKERAVGSALYDS